MRPRGGLKGLSHVSMLDTNAIGKVTVGKAHLQSSFGSNSTREAAQLCELTSSLAVQALRLTIPVPLRLIATTDCKMLCCTADGRPG